MKVLRKQGNAKDCIVCGIDNPYGIHANFYEMEDHSLCALFHYHFSHQSYPERVHGGLICAMIDETIGRAIWCQESDVWGCTIKINIEYRKAVPYDVPLKCVAKIDKSNGVSFHGIGEIVNEKGEVLARGDALYIRLKKEMISPNACQNGEKVDVDEPIEDGITDIEIIKPL